MNPTDVIVVTQWSGTGLVVLARLLGEDGEAITKASIPTIIGRVMDKRTGTSVATLTVTNTNNLYDTLQTADPRWTVDDDGYNFLHVVPASAFPLHNKQYRVGYKFTPLVGESFGLAVDVATRRLLP